MGERWLIVNADDFGICESADRAILRLFGEKRITSVSLLCPAPRAGSAIHAAASLKIPAGVHWALHCDWAENRWHAVAPAGSVPSLDDGQGLTNDKKLLAKRAKSAEVTAELEAQVEKIAAGGCPPDHADCHSDLLYGLNGRPFFLNAFRLCRKYRLPFRLPKRSAFLADLYGGEIPRPVRALFAAVVGLAGAMGVDLPDDEITDPRPVRRIPNYESLRDYYLRRAASAREGVTEMFLHPACPDPRMEALTPEWAKREMELRFLLGDDLLKLADREGLRLVSWGTAPFRHRKRPVT